MLRCDRIGCSNTIHTCNALIHHARAFAAKAGWRSGTIQSPPNRFAVAFDVCATCSYPAAIADLQPPIARPRRRYT
jgi:hypothetical protein